MIAVEKGLMNRVRVLWLAVALAMAAQLLLEVGLIYLIMTDWRRIHQTESLLPCC